MKVGYEFLKSSSVGGLSYIPGSSRQIGLFWIATVSFSVAISCYMIYNAALYWRDDPIETTLETSPIAEVGFPKIIVCPPKVNGLDQILG